MYYISLSQKFLRPLNDLQTGTSYPAVRDGDVFDQEIPLPDIVTQHEIVKGIEKSLENVIEAEQEVENILKKSEILKQSILKSAFEGKLK